MSERQQDQGSMPAPPRSWVMQAEKSGDNANPQALVKAVQDEGYTAQVLG